jgi:hypothetical protein
MSKSFTARRAAKKGKLPQGCQTTSPYQRGPYGAPVWVTVIAARPAGGHIELVREDGHCFLVDRAWPIFVVEK